MTTAWRDALAAYIRQQAIPPDKFSHQPRLYDLTLEVGRGMAYDDDVVYAACYLHDLGVFVGHRPDDLTLLAQWDNSGYAIAQAPAILRRFGFPPSKIEAVQACISTHQPADTPETIEATILRDADILEQLGAVGILRTVAKIGRDTRFITFADALASLHRAVTLLPSLVRLPQSKELAVDRIRIHRAFLEAAAAEGRSHLD